jgi:hypothetical protein
MTRLLPAEIVFGRGLGETRLRDCPSGVITALHQLSLVYYLTQLFLLVSIHILYLPCLLATAKQEQ